MRGTFGCSLISKVFPQQIRLFDLAQILHDMLFLMQTPPGFRRTLACDVLLSCLLLSIIRAWFLINFSALSSNLHVIPGFLICSFTVPAIPDRRPVGAGYWGTSGKYLLQGEGTLSGGEDVFQSGGSQRCRPQSSCHPLPSCHYQRDRGSEINLINPHYPHSYY